MDDFETPLDNPSASNAPADDPTDAPAAETHGRAVRRGRAARLGHGLHAGDADEVEIDIEILRVDGADGDDAEEIVEIIEVVEPAGAVDLADAELLTVLEDDEETTTTSTRHRASRAPTTGPATGSSCTPTRATRTR